MSVLLRSLWNSLLTFCGAAVTFLAGVDDATQGQLSEGLEVAVHPLSLLPLLRGAEVLPPEISAGHLQRARGSLPRYAVNSRLGDIQQCTQC